MYLQKGMWNGTRIVTEEWIAEATKPTPTIATPQTNEWRTRQLESPTESSFPQEHDRHRKIARAASAMMLDALAGPHGSASRQTQHANN
jgi:hypothetical protein